MTESTLKAKPCPICGSPRIGCHQRRSGRKSGYQCCCLECGLAQTGSYYDSPEQAKECWSKRPAPTAAGVPIGANDRNGHPIHIGDTLSFDPKEWGGECIFTIELLKGRLEHPGAVGDLSHWCDVIRYWDGTVPASGEAR